MGSLTPDATYEYEYDQGVVYATESGTADKKVIGWEYDPRTSDRRPLHDHIMDSKLWGDIHRTAKTNSALQEALERVIILYHLSKDNAK